MDKIFNRLDMDTLHAQKGQPKCPFSRWFNGYDTPKACVYCKKMFHELYTPTTKLCPCNNKDIGITFAASRFWQRIAEWKINKSLNNRG